MNAKSDSHSSLVQTFYCAGCNERFRVLFVPRVCPRCDVKVDRRADAELVADALLYKHLSGIQAPGAKPVDPIDDELDSLIGRNLHVYRCETLLGRGGMGCVYLAYHHDLHRKCALKILSPQSAADDVDYTKRFQLEGRSAAALVHPNIVTTHAIGKAEGYHFLEMEFVAGRSLQQLIQDEGRLTPVRATALATQIAEGLSAAHTERIIHRDLKPDNVLLTHQGIPKIADFGLAKRVHTDDTLPADYLIGTPNFMAPELFRGEPATPACDVYALGVTYFLLLTGRLPFADRSITMLKRSVNHDPLPSVRDLAPDVSLEMAECVSLLTAKTPGNRPRDGIEAAQLLHAVSGQVRDIESMLNEAFRDATGISWSRDGNQYQLLMLLPDNRHQTLFVEPSDHAAAEKLILIYSVCCRAEPQYYEEALRLNSEIAHGALSIREIEGKSYFVMIDTYPRSSVDPEEIRRSVLEVAYRADAVEKLLTGLDHH